MTPEYHALLSTWLKGHALAVDFVERVCTIAHVCDDLTDRDKPVTTAEVQASYWSAMIELPRNMFYVEHFALLNGAMQLAFFNWQIANRMEREDAPNAKEIAYVLRSSYTDLVTLCAWIVGGTEWAQQVGYESRLHAGREGFQGYLAALTHERRTPLSVEG